MVRTLRLSILGPVLFCLASCGGGGSDGGSSGGQEQAVESVTIMPNALALLVGESGQLTAITRDQGGNQLNGRAITWATSDGAVATVSTLGLVEGVGAGSATITATSEGQSGSAAVSVSTSVAVTAVATGGAHTCVLMTNGTVFCWGRGESGQLGNPPPSTTCPLDGSLFPCSTSPIGVAGAPAFVQLVAGGAHTCALTNDGTAHCWGSNTSGQLGDDSTTDRHAPVPVATDLKFASIDAGAEHTCGLTSDGAAYCWGLNSRGQLGDGTTTTRSEPVAVTDGRTFELITAGGFAIGHTCALTSSGDAFCWGDNERGQLGLATGGLGAEDLTPHPFPTRVLSSVSFVALTAGLGRHTCGLTNTGAAFCWGENTFGALGNDSMSDSAVPVAVFGGLVFAQLVAGGFIGHTCGLPANGIAHCWGENERGQLGDGSHIDRLTPSPVAGGLSFTAVAAGFRHTCALATTDTPYCWGSGAAGQLGNDSMNSSAVPVAVLGLP